MVDYNYYRGTLGRIPMAYVPLVHDQILDQCVVEHSLQYSDIEKLPEETQTLAAEALSDDSKSAILDYLPAGVSVSLANAILWLSYPKNWSDVNSRIAGARNRMDDIQRIMGFVCGVFGYKPEELEEMTFDQFADRVALAELAVTAAPKIPIELQNPEELTAARKRKLRHKDFVEDAISLSSAAGQTIEDKQLRDSIKTKRTSAKEEYDKSRAEAEDMAEDRKKQIREANRQYMSKFIR